MLAIPNSVELQESIVKLGGESSVEPMLFAVEVDIETLRGDGAGQHEVVLVDLPWVVADHFSVPTNSRGILPRGAVVIQLKVGGKICRPVKASVFAAANHWISSGLDEDTAQDYLTASRPFGSGSSSVWHRPEFTVGRSAVGSFASDGKKNPSSGVSPIDFVCHDGVGGLADIGYESRNLEMLGLLARMMFFIEHASR